MIRKILKTLKIIQTRKVLRPLGNTHEQFRLNPYNPLTYVFILIVFVISVLLFGIVGFIEQIDLEDLKFKYR